MSEVKDYWFDMPEYGNENISKPEMTITLKFRTRGDYDSFVGYIQPLWEF